MKHIHFIIFFGVLIMSCNSKNHNSEITATVSEKLNEPRKIQFLSLDSLIVTANLYDRGNEFPVILLCHQAGFNKIEYTEIAKTLYNKGFNCLAIDQRSGGNILESFNETLLEANITELELC